MPPSLALFAGDPAGIGPELVAKIIAMPESLPPTRVHLIASRAGIEAAGRAAGVSIDFASMFARDQIQLIEWDGWKMPAMTAGAPLMARGGFTLRGLRVALDLLRRKLIDAVCFAPIDRAALRAAGMTQEDELELSAQILNHRGPCHEIHVLDNVWTVSVGAASSAGDVKPLSAEDVVAAVAVLADALRRARKSAGRIAVCAPHRPGDNHLDDYADAMVEGVRLAVARGFTAAQGPLPADVAFALARNWSLDGVITTGPKQEPIAGALLGYQRGVTVLGGLPSAVTTTTHGTGHDIAGRGIANPWALRNAIALALRIASG